MEPIDAYFEAFKIIAAEFPSLQSTITSEADTRLKIIDRVLQNALGWPLSSIATEQTAGDGYLDYRLSVANAARAVVEAKKEAISFGIQDHHSGQAFKLNGPVLNSAAKDAVKQAVTYCAFKNAELACATNGSEWIIFRGNRLGDGQDTLDGKAFVFASLKHIQDNFSLFYSLLGEQPVRELRFRGYFQEAEGIALRDLSFFRQIREPSSRKLLQRGGHAIDLDEVMNSFFRRLKGEEDKEMILNCFVVTAESQVADQKLERIAEDLVVRMREVNMDTGKQLVEVIQSVQNQQRHKFVLLVGNKGAGKSTFIERFFRFILPAEVAEGLVVIQVNVAHSAGDPSKIVDWLNAAVLSECERVLFNNGRPAWEDYVGAMFFDEYQRWSQGSMKPLYEKDKEQFKIEFGRHIENVRTNQPHEFIKRLLRHIVYSRKRVPCLVFDNTDHFTIQFQEAVFQYARSLYESEVSLVLTPITDRTSWQLSRQGAMQSFESEVLYLPVPDAHRVIERRISYLSEQIKKGRERQTQDYFLGRGIKLNINDLAAFTASLNRIFVETKSTSEWLGGLVNYDVRRLLEQTRDVIASPHIPLDELLKAHITDTAMVVPEWKIKHAIIKRRYDIYPEGDHPYLQNIYALTTECVSSPLLGIRILQFLRDATTRVDDVDRSFVQISSVYEHFTGLGIPIRCVSLWLEVLLRTALILEYDPTITEIEHASRVELSSAGKVHLIWGTSDSEYIKCMMDVTPLREQSTYDEVLDCIKHDYFKNWPRAVAAFIDYLIMEDERYCQIPKHRLFLGQVSVVPRLRRAKQLILRPRPRRQNWQFRGRGA